MLIEEEDIEWLKKQWPDAEIKSEPIAQDECHSGIFGMKGNSCKKLIKYLFERPNHIFLCAGKDIVPFSPDQFMVLKGDSTGYIKNQDNF